MSTSRIKQRKQGKARKTKSNGSKYKWAKSKKMTKGAKHLRDAQSGKTKRKR